MQDDRTGADPPPRLWPLVGRPLAAVFLFSAVINLLTLTGPVYMLQVYDRVLTTRSEVTLWALTGLAAGLYACFGLLDYLRGTVCKRVAVAVQARFDGPGFDRAMAAGGAQPVRAVDCLCGALAGGAPAAVLDALWVPVFLAAVFLFHPWLGWFALAGAALVALFAALALFGEPRETRIDPEARLRGFLDTGGMPPEEAADARSRWQRDRALRLRDRLRAGNWQALLRSGGRALRMFLQSAILGLGALLVLRDALSPGAMVAVSILLGRALSPLEQLGAAIPQLRDGLRAAGTLQVWAEPARRRGPPRNAPDQTDPLRVRDLAVCPPGSRTPVLRDIGFTLGPGQALGLIGATGAGKTALIRAVTGIWPATAGTLSRGAGARLGYMPQAIRFCDDTLARNIHRFAPRNEAALARALELAGADRVAARLAMGPDTPLGPHPPLSRGEAQLLALARACFGAPDLLVLDEPDAHLDAGGLAALQAAIAATKARGGAVLIASQRPGVLQLCDRLLHLENRRCRVLGPRDEVLHALGHDTRWAARAGAA